jgi:uncharacterized membrane protein YdbT with pleckstrin-like domain
MIKLNKKINYPWSARLYGLTWIFIVLLIFTFIGSFSSHGYDTFKGFSGLMIFIALWKLLKYACINYFVDDKSLIINSGVFVKRSKYIPFSSIQNITVKKGLILMICGVSQVNIWTSSPSQIQIVNGNSENRPSGLLFLDDVDAEWLKNHIHKTK